MFAEAALISLSQWMPLAQSCLHPGLVDGWGTNGHGYWSSEELEISLSLGPFMSPGMSCYFFLEPEHGLPCRPPSALALYPWYVGAGRACAWPCCKVGVSFPTLLFAAAAAGFAVRGLRGESWALG